MPHYYDEEQDSELNLRKIKIRLKNTEFDLYGASGIFSKDKLDFASWLLIENCIIKPDWKILDLGCGYGAIGISLKKIHPELKVLMSDVNKRAVFITKKNIKLNNLENKNIGAIHSDLFKNEKLHLFDSIICNPPMAAGRELCFRLIQESHSHLNEGGLLQIVARHNKGGRILSEKMKEVFGNVKEVAKKSGFRIYVSEKS